MILETLETTAAEFERATGWALKPEGACRGEICVPLGSVAGGRVDVAAVAEPLGMPLVGGPGAYSLGPATVGGGRALATAVAPDLTLPDRHGRPFSLSSLRGRKVVVVAWAPW